jgi:zinc finger SWIM domain-containing protein 3
VLCEGDDTFKGLFFQDKQMIEAFNAYPELLCIDATYKLLDLRLPVYLMLVEDSNGLSEIVAVCILVSEDTEGIQWMIEQFKKHNRNWDDIRVIMADKDIKERDTMKKLLPSATVLICLFHTLRTFRREITTEKMGITSGERIMCLEYVQKMAYASSFEEYNSLYEFLKENCPPKVVEYFNENWHELKDEWVLGFKASCGSFLNFTNNRLESINGKLKHVIDIHSSLEEFVSKFFIILTSLRTERDHKAIVHFQKVRVQPFLPSTPEAQYSKILTSYALRFVLKQITLADKVKIIHGKDDTYEVKTSEGTKTVSTMDCACIFRRSMKLPCRHIFALRKQLEAPLFDSKCCANRWTLGYYRDTQRVFNSLPATPSLDVSFVDARKQRKLTQHEKFRKATILTTELATIVSEASHIHFYRRLGLLKDLIASWKSGMEVALADVDSGKLLGLCL